jgi:hypothetical protein
LVVPKTRTGQRQLRHGGFLPFSARPKARTQKDCDCTNAPSHHLLFFPQLRPRASFACKSNRNAYTPPSIRKVSKSFGTANRGGSAYGGLNRVSSSVRCASGKRPSNKKAPRN